MRLLHGGADAGQNPPHREGAASPCAGGGGVQGSVENTPRRPGRRLARRQMPGCSASRSDGKTLVCRIAGVLDRRVRRMEASSEKLEYHSLAGFRV